MSAIIVICILCRSQSRYRKGVYDATFFDCTGFSLLLHYSSFFSRLQLIYSASFLTQMQQQDQYFSSTCLKKETLISKVESNIKSSAILTDK